MDKLEVQIGANTDNLKRGYKEAVTQTKKFGKAVEQSAASSNKLSKGAKKSSLAAVELGRALGDLPFGIQGVANNMQQLAFVMGAGAGLQIGIAAITAGLVALERGAFNTTDSIDKLNKATVEFTGTAKAEISTLSTLLKIARDENNAKEVREKAIKSINKKYSKYLGNLTTESVNTDKVKNSVNELTKALLTQARVRGAQQVLEEQFKELAEKTAKIIKNNADFSKRRASEQIQENRERLKTQQQVLQTLEAEQAKGKNVGQAIGVVTAEIERLKQVSKLSGRDIIAQGILTDVIKEETAKAETEIKTFQTVLETALKDTFTGLDLGGTGDGGEGRGIVKALFPKDAEGLVLKQYKELEKKLREKVGPSIKGLKADLIPIPNKEEIIEAATRKEQMIALLDDFNAQANAVINGGIANTFAGVGEVIGQALAGGGATIKDLGAVLLGNLGSVLVELGKMAIAVGVGLEAVKKSLESLNPVAAIAAGVALVAIGSAFSAGAKKLSKGFGGGGGGRRSVSGSGGVSSVSSGSTTTLSGSTSFQGGNVVFEIQGTRLVGVLNNTLQRNRALGGSGSTIFG